MKTIFILVASCLSVLVGCRRSPTYPSYDFRVDAACLTLAQRGWISDGRPDTDVSAYVRPTDVYFVFTNTVYTTNAAFHCHFGAHRPSWPNGVLAGTDEGVVVWIRSRDGAVIVSPELNGVEP